MQRPPIVVVMGHVDHGKTTLLDYIRKTNIAIKEVGGITQSIGAYEIEYKEKKITFIDTPGHQVFSNMRKYGAKIADIAVLVVAADDGVMPQTKEAIRIIQDTNIPYIVAINKIDKPNANLDKTINDLMQEGVFLEKYGGNIPWEEISALKGKGVENLLDLILLLAEMENLEYSEKNNAYGFIIKSSKDPKKGIIVSGILKDGKIEEGQLITTYTSQGKIKILNNFLGKRVKELLPSAPFEIVGFEEMPKVGEEFWAGKNLDIKLIQKENKEKEKKEVLEEKDLTLILKADDFASLEALKNLILSMQTESKIYIAKEDVGVITEGDVKDAIAFNALIIGFRTKIDKPAEILSKTNKIKIITSEIIYELEKIIKEELERSTKKELRSILILKNFGITKDKRQIIGGRVILGPIKNQESFEIWFQDKKIGEGKIINLQSQKQDVLIVETGNEVGLLVEAEETIKENYILNFK